MNMTKAYIIPGYTHTAKRTGYASIQHFCEKYGIDAQIVHISWKRYTMTDYVKQFLEQYEKHSEKTIVLGFSFGAMIAAIAQQHAPADQLILCSLSPYFKEDLPKLKKWWKTSLGKKRIEDFQQQKFVDIARQIKSKTYIIVGNKEGSEVMHRATEAKKLIKKSVLHILPDVKHDIADKRYQQKIQEIIKNMSV